VIARIVVGLLAILLPAGLAVRFFRRGADRLLAAPRTLPEEAELGPALDALGGEVVRLRARDGHRLAARWLPATVVEDGDHWAPDPHEALLLLHGYSGSVAPDLVEYGPFLRRTAGIFGLDFRGHGESDPAPTTFGLHEVEDVAGALAWLGERGIDRLAIFGTSMGGIVAIAATAILGDGRLSAADADPAAPRGTATAPRPQVVAIVGESVSPDLVMVVANRIRGPFRRFVARRVFDAAASRLGADPRATEPVRLLPLLEDLPVLLIHGTADTTVPIRAARRLAERGGPGVARWEVADAEHSAGHRTAPSAYEAAVTAALRRAFADGRPTVDAPPVRVPVGTTGPGQDPAAATL
jgi:pimeloyl-ACP methyl ester carboxylesterase